MPTKNQAEIKVSVEDQCQSYLQLKAEALSCTVEDIASDILTKAITQQQKNESAGARSYELRDFNSWLQNQMHDPVAREMAMVLEQYLKGGSMRSRREPSIDMDKRITVR